MAKDFAENLREKSGNNVPIRFGTDGWRALMDRDFTLDNVRACAQGVAKLLVTDRVKDKGLVIGYDTRLGSAEYAMEVARVMASRDIPVYLCDRVTPTPVVSYNVVNLGAAGGVVITASHNPAGWNGFKYKPSYGGSADSTVVARLEEYIASAITENAPTTGRNVELIKTFDPAQTYMANLRRVMDLSLIRQGDLRVAVDSMHGAGAGYLATLLQGGHTLITEYRSEADDKFPDMIQPEPIAQNLNKLAEVMRSGKLDVAFATDGDADRLGVLDEHGTFLTTLQTFSLLCLNLLEVRGARGAIVKSLTQSTMLEKLGQRYSVDVITTPVGFKHLGPVMLKKNALAAGEESGGYAFRGNIPERDGLFSALLFLELMVVTGRRPSELVNWLYERVGPHHYGRLDLLLDEGRPDVYRHRIDNLRPDELGGLRVERRSDLDGVRFGLESGYWGLVRFSGTEPLVRLYAESESEASVQLILKDLKNLVLS